MRTTTALRVRAWVTAFTCLSILLVASGPALAAPSTPAIDKKRAEAEAARTELERMSDELEVAVEEYNAITEALDETRVRIREAEERLVVARAELAAARERLARRATSIYKDGGTGLLDVLLGTRSFTDFLVRVDLAVRINRQDAEAVAAVKEAKATVEATERALVAREAEQAALQAQADARREAIEASIERQRSFVAQLDAEVKRLVAEEEERQRRLAEERARRAAAAAAAYAARGRQVTDPAELGAGHPEVVAIALEYLGVPYVWGGATPMGFDCSGLCQFVYGRIGIRLPRTSRSQFAAGQHIPPDRLDLLQPGDLVFFGTEGDPSRVHHVGIYAGNGDYIHAPEEGDVVKVSSLVERIERKGDYVGASRF